MPYNRLKNRGEEANRMATKTVYNLRGLDYKFDNTRRGSKYEWFDTLLNEYKRGNAGDFFEIADKFVKGYDTHKDGNGKYNEGSDIEETHTSCKSCSGPKESNDSHCLSCNQDGNEPYLITAKGLPSDCVETCPEHTKPVEENKDAPVEQ